MSDAPFAHTLPLTAPSTAAITTYGWEYNAALQTDENLLDLALALSRNSHCEGGHMGCVIVRPASTTATPATAPVNPQPPATSLVTATPSASQQTQPELLVLAINSTLYEPASCKSDVHAEQNAISLAARAGVALQGTTAYITMPPCRTCFGLLQAAGVSRVVFRRKNHLPEMDAAAERLGIPLVQYGSEAEEASTERVRKLWQAYLDADPERAAQEAAAGKELQKAARELKKRKAIEKAEGAAAMQRSKASD